MSRIELGWGGMAGAKRPLQIVGQEAWSDRLERFWEGDTWHECQTRAWSRLTVLPPPSRLLLHATSKPFESSTVSYQYRHPQILRSDSERPSERWRRLPVASSISRKSTRQEDLAPADRTEGVSVIFSQTLEEAAAGLHSSHGGPLATWAELETSGTLGRLARSGGSVTTAAAVALAVAAAAAARGAAAAAAAGAEAGAGRSRKEQ